MEVYSIRNLNFTYPGAARPALEEVSLAIGQGEFLVLAGRSGSGKTTLLRMLKSVLRPHGTCSGGVYFCGSPLDAAGPREQAARIGFVLQSADGQIVTDKVWHELAFGLENLGCDNAFIRKRVAETASFFGMENWFEEEVRCLSGGRRRLLGLASVMVTEPDVIILDEPVSQLDPVAADEFVKMLEKISRELGTTVIVSEQRLEKVLPLADRLAVLEGGRLALCGRPAETAAALALSGNPLAEALPAAARIWAGAHSCLGVAQSTGTSEEEGFLGSGGKCCRPVLSVPGSETGMSGGETGTSGGSETAPSGSSCPLTVRDGRRWLAEVLQGRRLPEQEICENEPGPVGGTGGPAKRSYMPAGTAADEDARTGAGKVSIKHLYFRYDRNAEDVLADLSLELHGGETAALLGGNGAGKTTLLKCIAGIYRPYAGSIEAGRRSGDGRSVPGKPAKERAAGIFRKNAAGGESDPEALRIVMLPQEPKALFRTETVAGDLKALSADGDEDRVQAVLERLQLRELAERHPFDLSGGELQMAAFAAVLMRRPDVLLLDEPTKGLDAAYKKILKDELSRLRAEGVCILIVSHDLEFCAECADRCMLMFRGGIVSEGTPEAFFSSGNIYTTAPAAIARGYIRNAVTVGAVLKALGAAEGSTGSTGSRAGSINGAGRHDQEPAADTHSAGEISLCGKGDDPAAGGRRPLYLAAIWLLIPVTLLASVLITDGRRYALTSLLVLIEGMLPFFLMFEGRKPPVRELLLLAVLCAIGVAGRAALFMFPSFKPVIALAVISGIALGPEDGFIVGAMTMLVSNAFFAQGPWTPWEMFAAGLTGFLAGLVFRGDQRMNKTVISIFGFFCCIIIYGGIMNPASAYMWDYAGGEISLLAYYISGLPVDLVHGIATAVFLWFGAEPMLRKLDRAVVKYGLR